MFSGFDAEIYDETEEHEVSSNGKVILVIIALLVLGAYVYYSLI